MQKNQIIIFVRRIVKDKIERLFRITPDEIFGGVLKNLGSIFGNFQIVEVLFDERAGAARFVDKRREFRAARKRFDADRARSGAKIEKARMLADLGRENIK